MAVPTLITDLSTTASSNAPAGSDSPSTLDDISRAHASFIAQLHAEKLAAAGVTAFAATVLDDANAAAARTTLGAAASGANSDITSLIGLTTPLSAALGGTGVANGFVSSLAASGYQNLPSGLIIQWGAETSANSTAITFPIAFPSAICSVSCVSIGATNVLVQPNTVGLTSFVKQSYVASTGIGAASSTYWIAIGY